MPDIAYRMSWTQTGLEETVDKSIQSVEKLSTSTSSLISRLERKASVADMGADAFALAQAKASGATTATLDYISALQGVINKTKTLKEESATAAAAQAKMDKDRQLHVAARRAAVPDNEELRSQSEYERTQAIARAERQQKDADRAARDQHIRNRQAAVPDNETLRQNSETLRYVAGQRALSEVTDTLRQKTRALRDEEISAIRTKLDLAGATDAQRASAMRAVDMHQSGVIAQNEAFVIRNLAQSYTPSAKAGTPADKRGRGAMVGLEMSRAIEDSIAGGAYGGWKGAIMGASNNISQMGAMMGPQAAIIASVASMATVLGVTLIPKIHEWATGLEAIKKKHEEVAAASKKAFEQESEQIVKRATQKHDETAQDNQFARDKDKPRSVAEIKQRIDSLQMERESLYRVKVEEEALRGQIARRTPKTKEERDKNNDEIRESKLRQGDADRKNERLHRQQLDLKTQADEQQVIEDRGKQAAAWMASNEWDMQQRNKDKAELANKKAKSESLADMRLSLMPEDTQQGKVRKASLRAEMERVKRDKQIDEGLSEGLISKADADAMKKGSIDRRNKDVQDAKGQDGGRQKAMASDVRSSEGMAQLLKALNANKDDIGRRQLDVLQEVAQAERDVAAILKDQEKFTVVTWN